jgi:hypothetical protein
MKISNVTLGEVSTRAPKALGMLYHDSMNQKTMTNRLPAGTYYVGDLCYVVRDDDWGDFCEGMYPEDGSERRGIFETAEGVNYANFGTKYGDGCYGDYQLRQYAVDSGTIGCIPVCALKEFDAEEIEHLGNVVEFPTAFEVGYDSESGTITFGHVDIITGDEYDYDYEEEDDE